MPRSRTCASFWTAAVLLPLFGARKPSILAVSPQSKAAEGTAALQDASAHYDAPEPAPAFGLRLSFCRFLVGENRASYSESPIESGRGDCRTPRRFAKCDAP